MTLVKMLLTGLLTVALVSSGQAEQQGVTKKTETRLDFKGGLGMLMKVAGAEKPTHQVETVAVNQRRLDTLDKKGKKVESTDIIDLDRQLFTRISHKDKKYTQMTFAEWREVVKSGFSFGAPGSRDESDEEPISGNEPEVEIKADISVEDTGETQDFDGNEAHEKVMTIKIEGEAVGADESGQTQQAAGGMNIISTMWVSNRVEGAEAFRDFNRRLIEKLGLMPSAMSFKAILDQLMQSNPELATAMEKAGEEIAKLDGTTWKNETIYESWGENKEQAGRGGSGSPAPSIDGLAKGLFGKKEKDKNKPKILLKSKQVTRELKTVSLADDYFAIPEDYDLELNFYQKQKEESK